MRSHWLPLPVIKVRSCTLFAGILPSRILLCADSAIGRLFSCRFPLRGDYWVHDLLAFTGVRTTHNRQPTSYHHPRPRSSELAQYFAWVRQTMLSILWDTMWRGIGVVFPILRIHRATTRIMASTTRREKVHLPLCIQGTSHILFDLDLIQL